LRLWRRGGGDEFRGPLARGRLAAVIVLALLLASLPLLLSYFTLVATSFSRTIVSNPWAVTGFPGSPSLGTRCTLGLP